MHTMKVVKLFTYRSALIPYCPDTIIFPIEDQRVLHEKLAKLAGVRPDNHVVYVVTGVFGDPNMQLAIGFSDHECCMGHYIRKWDCHNHSLTRNVELELSGDFTEE